MKKLFFVSFAALLSTGPINAQEKQDEGIDAVGNSILWQSFRAGMDEKELKQAIKQDPLTEKQRPYFDKAQKLYRVGIVPIMNANFILSFEMSGQDRDAKLIAVALSSDGSKYGSSPSTENCVAEKIKLFRKIVSGMGEKYQAGESGEDYAEFINEGTLIRVSFEKALLIRPEMDSTTLSSEILYRLHRIRSAAYDVQKAQCQLSDAKNASTDFSKYLSLMTGGDNVGVVNIHYTDSIALQTRNNLTRLEREAKEREQRQREEASKANL